MITLKVYERLNATISEYLHKRPPAVSFNFTSVTKDDPSGNKNRILANKMEFDVKLSIALAGLWGPCDISHMSGELFMSLVMKMKM